MRHLNGKDGFGKCEIGRFYHAGIFDLISADMEVHRKNRICGYMMDEFMCGEWNIFWADIRNVF